MMLTPADRDRALHQLYQNRELLMFTMGEDWFVQQVRAIHWDWEQSGTFLKVTDSDVNISMIAFEIDNGY